MLSTSISTVDGRRPAAACGDGDAPATGSPPVIVPARTLCTASSAVPAACHPSQNVASGCAFRFTYIETPRTSAIFSSGSAT